VLSKLLDVYTTAVNNKAANTLTNYDKLILKTLPEIEGFLSDDLYVRLLSVSSYIASLTDSNALLLYRKVSGMAV
jgi:dGTPase